MSEKTPPFENYPQWTSARFFGWLRSGLRRMWLRSPMRNEALNNALVGRKTNKKTGKLAKHYKCAKCKKEFVAKDVQVDHITDVGTLKGWGDVGEFVKRLFCSSSELSVLCKQCHKKKTNKNRKK